VKLILLSEEEKANNYTMICQLFSLLLHSSYDSMKFEICEFIKGLLDPDCKDLKDEFFDLFYNKILPQLVDFISDAVHHEDELTISLVLDILTYCARSHGYRSRYYVTHNSVLIRLSKLYSVPSKTIRLAMIRLLRTLVGTNDENISKHIAKLDLFEPLFKLLSTTKRDNLITSAILDLFNTVASQSIRTLIGYMVDKYGKVFIDSPYAIHPVMKKIRSKYDLFPSAGAPKREMSQGKRAFLNYPGKEEEVKIKPTTILISDTGSTQLQQHPEEKKADSQITLVISQKRSEPEGSPKVEIKVKFDEKSPGEPTPKRKKEDDLSMI